MKRGMKTNLAKLENLCHVFNEGFPVGTPVILRKDSGEVETTVKYAATVIGGHSAVAWFEGVSGGYSIEDGRVRQRSEVPANC